MARGVGNNAPRDPISWMAKEIATLKQRVREISSASILNASEIDPTGTLLVNGAIHVVGTETVDGTLEVGGNLNVDGTETVGGTLHVTGNTIIGGTLSLPAGIIDNAALAAPVTVKNGLADLNSVNITVPGSSLLTSTIAVPAGFTQALVYVVATAGDSRTAAGPSALYAQAFVNGTGGGGGPLIGATCATSSSMSVTTAVAASITGLVGGGNVTYGIFAAVDGSTGWVSGAGNVHIMASATFLR